MGSSMKRVKAVLREVVHGGRISYSCVDSGVSSQITRYNHGQVRYRSERTRGKRELAEPADSAHKHLINGSTLKEAVARMIKRVSQGVAIKSYSYGDVLQGCLKQKDFESVKQVHDCIKKSGLETNTYVVNNLMKCYIGCGKLQSAQELFNKLLNKSIVSWTIMIGGYAENDQPENAILTYTQFRKEGGQPDAVIYLTVLKACGNPNYLKLGKEIHAHILHDGFQAHTRLGTALVSMYAMCGSIEDARAVFDGMETRDVISWNAMIGGLAQHGHGQEAFSLFREMQREGFTPDSETYIRILSARATPEDEAWVKKIQIYAKHSGLGQDVRVNSALIHTYAKCGNMNDAKSVFDSVTNRDVICWNVMIGGLAQHGLGHEAFSLFLQMVSEGYIPDSTTYVNILHPCSSEGALGWVKEIHAHATKTGHDVDLRVGTALVHMFAKIGSIGDARQVFDKILDRDVVTWTSMIGGLAQHGHAQVALQLYEEMKVKGVKPSGSLFVVVLLACSHAGLVDEGRFQFSSMTGDHDIKPALKHYTCIADILGRAGHLEEAKRFILSMPTKPDIVTWRALLGACKIYNIPTLGELAARECLKLEPMDPSIYVLLSNIYAAAGNWKQASLIRNMMEERGIRKDPGRCWIEVDNKVHYFVAGDTSHPEAKEIYSMLNNMFEKLNAEGYIPDTRFVLRKIDEKDKESSLCTHSEKLAIAYGLMHVTSKEPIRIYKNLRICSDCHTATKLISKITGREIVARDASRFHHFKEGLCSCGDYW